MIRIVDQSLIEQFHSYCADKPFGIRMAAALKSYGTDCRFADFWLVLDDDKIVGAISRLDEAVTLCADKVTDELCDFICAVGGQVLMAEKDTLQKMGFYSFFSEGAIMRYTGNEDIDVGLTICSAPSIMEACKLLFDCEGESIKVGELDRFYTDLSLRVRRGTAVCYSCDDKGVAIATAITDTGAIIGGVAVRENERRNGIGGALVSKLVSDLRDDKKIYLLRLRNENESFYKGLGFENVECWASISRGCE